MSRKLHTSNLKHANNNGHSHISTLDPAWYSCQNNASHTYRTIRTKASKTPLRCTYKQHHRNKTATRNRTPSLRTTSDFRSPKALTSSSTAPSPPPSQNKLRRTKTENPSYHITNIHSRRRMPKPKPADSNAHGDTSHVSSSLPPLRNDTEREKQNRLKRQAKRPWLLAQGLRRTSCVARARWEGFRGAYG